MATVNYGSKRLVTGARYGMRDWLAQRITAVLMTLYTAVLLLHVLLTRGPMGYENWARMFAPQWMRLFTLVVLISLGWHAWVGMRDIWMDYVKSVGLRLLLQVATLVWLVGCIGWAIQVLWKI
ncbi:MAG TPA: succinate dehydrogenase, hydrophobic membrane anchor protein [Rubrivivax sp.]|nr:succinate dehydrogenase, hydrophobic membrane anchor protein [Rubrivivax sp.]